MTEVTERKRVLVVDDESNVRESLRLILNREYEVDVAESGSVALEILRSQLVDRSSKSEGNQARLPLPDLVLLDVVMPGCDGLKLLEEIKADYPAMPVIMLTANKTVKTAVAAMKIGAVDYLNKPFEIEELLSLIDRTLVQVNNLKNLHKTSALELSGRADLPNLPGDFGCMVGRHPVICELYQKINQVAERDTTVLVTGESGTGKELVAREIHKRSRRASGPFIPLNCAAIPETLIESELFGHEKGSFTHAIEKRIGHFELATNGTLFLDEIGELSLPVQVKMLRFLQDQEFYRIGCSKPIKVDVRIVAATNRSLEVAIQEGRFRQDLYYRINVVSLEVPPLRERLEDIPHLVDFFLKRFSSLYSGRAPKILDETMNVLMAYSWPGNVRELENVTESILALTTTSEISPAELPPRIRGAVRKAGGDLRQNVLDGITPFEEAERAFEKELIEKALEKTNYVQTRAAELLGISRRILKYKMDKLGLSDKAPQSD
ncbi:MAG: sigma-54-dependent Fis family transcriptional regulator [Deltaproteobacteria bacterium]|nr:sigma-54-dependent Fis family transcriptional regulator [Deltaproteobacteria bacterium]